MARIAIGARNQSIGVDQKQVKGPMLALAVWPMPSVTVTKKKFTSLLLQPPKK